MRKKLAKAVARTLFVTSFAMLGCDPGPADAPPVDDTSVEIDAVPQAHTSSDTVTKWKFQNRTRDGVITGKSADGKERFRARMAIMPDLRTTVFIVTKPSVLVMSVQHLSNGSYELVPTPVEVATPFEKKTTAYLKQLHDDIAHHKHGFDEKSCFAAGVTAGGLVAKTLFDSAACVAAVRLGIPNPPSCDLAQLDAGLAGAAAAVMANTCGWVEAIMDKMDEMDAAVNECNGLVPSYGISFSCNT